MSTPATFRSEDQTCYFWMNHSEGCAHVKHGTASIVAALAVIAILAGVLLILAQQGFDLAGINSIAQMVESKWIYMGLGVATGVLVIDTVFIIAQVHSYLNKTFSDHELADLSIDIPAELTANQIREQLELNTFAFVEIPAEKGKGGKPPVYLVVSKDENGVMTQLPFRDKDDALAEMQLLEETYGYEDGIKKFANTPTYPRAYVEAQYGEPALQTKEEETLNLVEPGNYLSQQLSIPTTLYSTSFKLPIWMLALKNPAGEEQVIYYKTPAALNDAIEQRFPNYFSQMFVNRPLIQAVTQHVLAPLAANQHWKFELPYVERTCYAVLVKNSAGIEKVHPFFSESERNIFLHAYHLRSTDAQPLFNANTPYTETEVSNLCFTAAVVAFKNANTKTGVYYTHALPMTLRPDLYVYALCVGNDNPSKRTYHYFKTPEQGDAHIITHLSGQIDHSKVIKAVQTVVAQEKAEAYCLKAGDYWPCSVEVDGHPLPAAAILGSHGLTYQYWLTPEARLQAFQTGEFSDPKNYRNTKEHTVANSIFQRSLVNLFVKGPKDYWIASADTGFWNVRVVYYRVGNFMKFQTMPESQVAAFLKSQNLDNNAREKFEATHEFPAEEGAHLLALGVDGSALAATIKEDEPNSQRYLAEGEHVSYKALALKDLEYKEVFVAYVHHRSGNFAYHYFETSAARLAFFKAQNLTNGWVRDEHQYQAVQLVGKTIYESQAGEKKPLVFSFEHPDKKTTCLITYTNDRKDPVKTYVPAADLVTKIQELEKTHKHITLGESVSAVEQLALNKADSASYKTYITDSTGFTQPKQYILRAVMGYYVLYVRHADKNTPEREAFYFRSNAQAKAYIESMQTYTSKT